MSVTEYDPRWDSYGPDPVPDCPVPGTHIWGWMRTPELRWLGAQAAQMDSIVEIGSLHGRSAFALLTACSGPVYCIDPWDDVHDLCFGSFMGACGHFPNLHPIRGFSPNDAFMVSGEGGPARVDMVFIDGDHSREGIEADIDEWLPRTRKLICGHDYTEGATVGNGYPDVKAVVDERFGDRVTVAEDTAIWAVTLNG